MPPVPETPETDGTFDFLNSSGGGPASPKAAAQAVQNLNVTDMFSGNEKEYVFSLLPGEERLDELTIHHQHVFVVKAGVTRVTLTTHRLLYTATRVFSPVYWLLLVLFPPLILYYVVRMSRNRNVSLPLDSIDSVEKRYRPNWLIFLVAVILWVYRGDSLWQSRDDLILTIGRDRDWRHGGSVKSCGACCVACNPNRWNRGVAAETTGFLFGTVPRTVGFPK